MTPTSTGGLSWATAALGLLLVGCPQGDDSNATGTEEVTGSEEESESDPSTSTTMTSMTMTDTDPTMGMTEPMTTTETTGPPPEGLGCGITPTCDKGEFVGNLVYESEADIEAFAGYTSVTGWVQFIQAPDLVCLDFMSCLETVGRDIDVSESNSLLSIQGFSNVTSVQNITFFSNAAMTSMAGFDSLAEANLVSVSQMPALVELNGWPALARLFVSLNISENPMLTTVTAFDQLSVIEQEINIQFNPVLTDLSGPSHLLALGGECIITNNDTLCVSQAASVCGDLKKPPASEGPPPGSTANNDDSC